MTAATASRVVRTTQLDEAQAVIDETGINLAEKLTSGDDARFGYAVADTGSSIATTMNVHEVVDHVRWLIMNPGFDDTTPIYVGPSGIGKTYAIREGARQAAEAMGRSLNMIEKHVSLMGPTDLGGVPRPEIKTKLVDGKLVEYATRRTEFLPPSDIPMESASPEHAAAILRFQEHLRLTGRPNWSLMHGHPLNVFFLDEFTNPSMPAVIHQCFPVIYGKHIANMPLLSDTQVILAGNRPQDGTSSITLPRSATLRVNTIEVIPSLLGWFQNWAFHIDEVPVAWEKQKDGQYEITEWERRPRIHPMIISYLNQHSGRFAPNLMKTPTGQPAPSPRTWNSVSTTLYAYQNPVDGEPTIPESLLFATVAGFIGQAEAHQFWAYRKYAKELPDVRKMLNSPGIKRSDDGNYVPYGWLPSQFPSGVDIQSMMATQMVMLVTKENARRFMRFLLDGNVFTPEVAAMTMKLMRPMGIVESVAHLWAPTEFTEWAGKFRKLIF